MEFSWNLLSISREEKGGGGGGKIYIGPYTKVEERILIMDEVEKSFFLHKSLYSNGILLSPPRKSKDERSSQREIILASRVKRVIYVYVCEKLNDVVSYPFHHREKTRYSTERGVICPVEVSLNCD